MEAFEKVHLYRVVVVKRGPVLQDHFQRGDRVFVTPCLRPGQRSRVAAQVRQLCCDKIGKACLDGGITHFLGPSLIYMEPNTAKLSWFPASVHFVK